jgi:hypothetical protein
MAQKASRNGAGFIERHNTVSRTQPTAASSAPRMGMKLALAVQNGKDLPRQGHSSVIARFVGGVWQSVVVRNLVVVHQVVQVSI